MTVGARGLRSPPHFSRMLIRLLVVVGAALGRSRCGWPEAEKLAKSLGPRDSVSLRPRDAFCGGEDGKRGERAGDMRSDERREGASSPGKRGELGCEGRDRKGWK